MKTLYVLLGPTAVGKTHLSLSLARMLGSPIINADSRQIYKGIHIGTAAPSLAEQREVKHYFVEMLDLDEYYSAARFEADVMKLATELFSETDNLLMSGGSMMYIDAVCNGIDDIPTIDEPTRQMVRERYESLGLERMAAELKLLDPQYYSECDPKNTRRVLHALEVCYMSGKPFSSFRKQKKIQRPFRIIKIGLQRERTQLFERINSRVDQMIDNGLVDEARALIPLKHLNALNTVGYKEMFDYFDGRYTLSEAVAKIQRNTRVYAKKQMTWFKRDETINWFDPSQESEITYFIKNTK